MEMRVFGRTGMQLSMLGFGCGAVGGLMVRGDPLDQERTIARAIAAGVNYFDTAGPVRQRRIGKEPRPRPAKTQSQPTWSSVPRSGCRARSSAALPMPWRSRSKAAWRDSAAIGSTSSICTTRSPSRCEEALSVRQVLGDVVPAFERLRQQGKTRFLGLTAIGDTTALHRVIDARAFDSAQVVYNMLNPSAATELPPNYPAQDYGRLFDHTRAAGVGVIGIRVLAGGALSGRPSVTRLLVRRPSQSVRR